MGRRAVAGVPIVKPLRRALAHEIPRKPHAEPGARGCDQQAGLDQPLKVQGDVVAALAQDPERGAKLLPGARVPRAAFEGLGVDDVNAVDSGDGVEEETGPPLDQPVDPGVRKRGAQALEGRKGMQDVPKRTEPDNEDSAGCRHGLNFTRILRIRSRVEWSLGSPTISTSPP